MCPARAPAKPVRPEEILAAGASVEMVEEIRYHGDYSLVLDYFDMGFGEKVEFTTTLWAPCHGARGSRSFSEPGGRIYIAAYNDWETLDDIFGWQIIAILIPVPGAGERERRELTLTALSDIMSTNGEEYGKPVVGGIPSMIEDCGPMPFTPVEPRDIMWSWAQSLGRIRSYTTWIDLWDWVGAEMLPLDHRSRALFKLNRTLSGFSGQPQSEELAETERAAESYNAPSDWHLFIDYMNLAYGDPGRDGFRFEVGEGPPDSGI